MKELKKGNKAPYHGYILNMAEYVEYCKLKEMMPEMIDLFETMKRGTEA